MDRHRVARRLRHVTRSLMTELNPADRIVVRALPSSRDAVSLRLQNQLQVAIRRAHTLMERHQ